MRAAWIAKRSTARRRSTSATCRARASPSSRCPTTWRRSTPPAAAAPASISLNTYDLPSRPLYNLTALTLHESAPGHAFQIPIAMEHKDQPAFRQLTYISAYGEGWALYCERLGVEMGMYDTPYDRFGMLGYQIWRAARLVVDTGIHSQGWTREQALDYFRAEHRASRARDRDRDRPLHRLARPGAVLLPRRACDSRRRAPRPRRRSASASTSAPSTTPCCELGSVPLPVLTARIDRFIAEGGKGPYPGHGVAAAVGVTIPTR